VATGDGHRNRFIDWWQVDPARVSVVENGSELVQMLDRNQLRAFKPAADQPLLITVVFLGAFEPWHGIHVLLPAFADAVQQIPSLRLILIGSGTELERIKQQISQLSLGAFVTLTGQLDIHRVAEYLINADIGVAPYCGWMEFSGLKLFDYKAAGLAIIVSGRDGQPATIQHGVTGLVVPPGEDAPLSEAIQRLALDLEFRHEMGRAARLQAETIHGWQHTAMNLEKVFFTASNKA
jgi:glycosyltransferase involved in cell wall biosynthesis